jgi:Putative MetA-pathway of phenol degradation
MLARIATAILALILCALAPLHAQDQPATPDTSAPIATDRPSVTDSSVVVPLRSIQAENGFLETKTDGQNIVDAPETLIRVGVLTKTELRLTVPDYFYNTSTAGGQTTGFGDVSLGVKQQLGPIDGFDVSAVLFLSFPTGANNVSSGGYDPGIQIPWSRALSPNWTVAGMLSMYWPTQSRRRNLTGESTILLDRQLTKSWDAFLEYAGDFPERGGNRHLLHVGTALKLARQHQLDFHFGVGLSPAAPDHFVGIGYSFRF